MMIRPGNDVGIGAEGALFNRDQATLARGNSSSIAHGFIGGRHHQNSALGMALPGFYVSLDLIAARG